MSVLSQVAAPVWTEIAAKPRVSVLARFLEGARRALALRLSQWAQSAVQREAQFLRTTALSVSAYDYRVALDMQAAADRHEWRAL